MEHANSHILQGIVFLGAAVPAESKPESVGKSPA